MHAVFIVRVLVCRHISGRCIDQLRDPVDDGRAGHFHRCRSVYGNRRLRLTDEGPVIPVEFIRCKCLSYTLGFQSNALFRLRRNNRTHAGRISGLDHGVQRCREQILLMGGRIAFLRLRNHMQLHFAAEPAVLVPHIGRHILTAFNELS